MLSGAPGAILGDEMGTGKSNTIIQFLQLVAKAGELSAVSPALVVAPSKTVPFWRAEFCRWGQSLPPPGPFPAVAFERRTAASSPHIHLIAYEPFQRPDAFLEVLVTFPYRVAVFDEARGFDDPSCSTFAHIDELRNASRRWVPFTVAVTGTPICASLQLNCHTLAAGRAAAPTTPTPNHSSSRTNPAVAIAFNS